MARADEWCCYVQLQGLSPEQVWRQFTAEGLLAGLTAEQVTQLR